MIELQIEARCHDCPKFEAVSERSAFYAESTLVSVGYIVKCANEELCEYLKKYLEGAVV